MLGIAPSVLDPAGPQAAHISSLWWLMFWVATAVFVLVLGFLLAAFLRRPRARVPITADRTLTRAVAASAVVTALILFGLLVASMWTSRAIASLGAVSEILKGFLQIFPTMHQRFLGLNVAGAGLSKCA